MCKPIKPCRLCGMTPDTFFGIEEANAICLRCDVKVAEWDDGPTEPKHELIRKWNELMTAETAPEPPTR